MGNVCKSDICTEEKPKSELKNLMSVFPDKIPLYLMAIPGTYNSCT